jgi:hypothetical protein
MSKVLNAEDLKVGDVVCLESGSGDPWCDMLVQEISRIANTIYPEVTFFRPYIYTVEDTAARRASPLIGFETFRVSTHSGHTYILKSRKAV